MPLHQPNVVRLQTPPDTRLQNQPTSSECALEETAEADEPPDPLELTPRVSALRPEFKKEIALIAQRRKSLLTHQIHLISGDESDEEETKRVNSNASTWSHGSNTSMAELTSDGGQDSPARSGTPSPPLPPVRFLGLSPIFNHKSFDGPARVRVAHHESIGPLQQPALTSNEQNVEAGLGRKRCITFACKQATLVTTPTKTENANPTELPRRPSVLKFACPAKPSEARPPTRLLSPPPKTRRFSASKGRTHRGSDATVRQESPDAVRKTSVVSVRRGSTDSDGSRPEATRFHEFANSEDEVDDWTRESTCHRRRITVDDTLNVENKLRRLVKEVEDEVDEEERLDDVDEAEEDGEADETADSGDDSDAEVEATYQDDDSDDGFQTDDEGGFSSGEESDAGSDYEWWAPGRPASGDHVEHIRPSSRRRGSDSSIASNESEHGLVMPTAAQVVKRRRSRAQGMRTKTPELPDSTDFVCGTLDEDRPLEDLYLSCLEQRRAAKHVAVPQDIDPTFPASDPELDEEDEEDEESEIDRYDESDAHIFLHGKPDPHYDSDKRSRAVAPKRRSPQLSPKRMRSPPPPMKRLRSPAPVKRTRSPTRRARSPPPRRLFGASPRRMRSPAPSRPLTSPPPTRRTSFMVPAPQVFNLALAERPGAGVAHSVPRHGAMMHTRMAAADAENEDEPTVAPTAWELPTRGAIDIVKGLEAKRLRRREKLLEKYCRRAGKTHKPERRPAPGKGAEKMREMGMELAGLARGRRLRAMAEGTHILSY
ncbi:hypothetical protein EJ06DRAFT_522391 [Trichodelitschia bisporula]|uniref:Extensin domain-containing protein n=1 Tax=Trichodelitschia bisporula TaxID=703511 RepID=A0A6G1HTV7_9PEZI|nr:hypothetical protein EJ06DRAFT_522391 [Trichodelitschia bisporula]